MAAVNKLPKKSSPPISPNKSRPRPNKSGATEQKNEMEDKTKLIDTRRVKDKNAAPAQTSVTSTSMEEANEVLTQSSGSQLKKQSIIRTITGKDRDKTTQNKRTLILLGQGLPRVHPRRTLATKP